MYLISFTTLLELLCEQALRNKNTFHQVTIVLATSKYVQFQGHKHLLTTGTDDTTLWLSPKRQWASNNF